jgi:myo-inositol 2-dehydrogenase/D-chiro-inositol 1-dehydrogenase
MRVGFIGSGGIAHAHAKGLSTVDGAELAAVFDLDGETAARFAKTYEVEACASQDELIDRVDAVYVLTPPRAHREPLIAAAAQGKAVVCEKPISTTLDDARAMVAAAEQHDVPFAMGFNNRFRPQLRQLRDAVATGHLGDVLSCWTRRLGYSRLAPGSDWRTSEGELAGMTIQSISHDIDMLRFVVGEIGTVFGLVNSSMPEVSGYDDNLTATLQFENGAVGNINASWSSHIGHGSRGVVGTRGSMSVEGPDLWTMTHVRSRVEPDGIERVDNYPRSVADDKGHAGVSATLLQAVRDGGAPEAAGRDGLRALEVSLALLESARSGLSVDSRG